MKKSIFLWAVAAVCGLETSAQQTTQPDYALCQYDDGALISSMSDNGKWTTLYAVKADGSGDNSGAKLYNVSTRKTTELNGGLDMNTVVSYTAYDVDNEGKTVVGELNHKPAYYSTASQKWIELAYNEDVELGMVSSITPDGRYAVGTVSTPFEDIENYREYGVLWDLNSGKEIALTGLPQKDMAHNQTNMNRFLSISADGNTILGCMSYSFIPVYGNPGGRFYYTYDVKSQTYKAVGFTVNDTKDWKPAVDGLSYMTQVFMSNNGKYLTGGAYMLHYKSPDDMFPDEYECPFVYDITTGDFKLYDDLESRDLSGWVIDNNGQVYGAESNSPYRSFSLYNNGYWVDYASGVKQHYGVDFLKGLGVDNSGTPLVISDDSKTLAVMSSIFASYVIQTPENFADYVNDINLLSAYNLDPTPGVSVSRLNTVTLTFSRDVQLLGGQNSVKLENMIFDDQVETSSSIKVSGSEVTIQFANGSLQEMPYRLVVPAKTFALLNDNKRTNAEISEVYNGRVEAPIAIVNSLPEQNTAVAKIDADNNPVLLELDAEAILDYEKGSGKLYRDEDIMPLADVFLDLQGTTIKAYTANVQYLYKDHTYRIVIPAGAFTEVTGNKATANEEYTLTLRGAYERQISYDENILFSDNFDQSGIMNFMVLDNDELPYSDVAKSHGFGDDQGYQTTYAWMPVKETLESTDIALASTSMYTPAGKADDWLILPQIYIFDHLCKLTFQSQSYLKSKSDRLKVYVWEQDMLVDYATAEIVDRIRKEGVLVYDELQSPGEDEDMLAGEWKDNVVSLEQFKGKNIYIAFVNDNEDQSEVYIDNLQVLHELPFYAQLTNDKLVQAKDEMVVKGILDIRDENKVYDDVAIRMFDAEGNLVSSMHEAGVSYKKGDRISFELPNPLPLKVGEETKFTVKFYLNDDYNELKSSVKSLAFQPVKRVVLEECTGTGCVNCPQGIEAISRLHKTYGDKFIPVGIHAYTGDPFSAGVMEYAGYLGLNMAPSARVNRGTGDPLAAMGVDSETGKLYMKAKPGEKPLWEDAVMTELAQPVEAEVTATLSYNEASQTFTVPVHVKYALSSDELNLKVFAVVLENGCVAYQSNGFSSFADPLLGEWGLGGKYASAVVNPYTHDHVVRGTFGVSYTGTPGLLPNAVKAGETYSTTLNIPSPTSVSQPKNVEVAVMLFDANTDKLVNACLAKSGTVQGIDGVEADAHQVRVLVEGHGLQIETAEKAVVAVYALDGRKLAQTEGEGSFTLAVPAFRGVGLVQVITTQGTVNKKVLF